jgi:hypothetical protein
VREPPVTSAAAVIAIALVAARIAGAAALVQTTDGRTAIDLARAAQPPAIDGRLDDPAWATPPLELP